MKKLLLSTLLLSMAAAGVSAQEYCKLDGVTLTRTSRPSSQGNDNRYANSIQVTSGTQTFNGSGYSKETTRPIYEEHLEQVITCGPGDVLTPTISYTGSWLHKYVYVDWGRDGTFDVGDAENGWEDLVSFNYINGQNSAGLTTSNDGSGSLGSFVVPADASGEYRIRFKVDWDSTDPCGNRSTGNLIEENGGAIIDLTLNVENKTVTPSISLASGSNIQKGINEIGVTCSEADAVIYYTTDGTEPTEGSAQAVDGNIAVDASSYNLQDKITVKVAAKSADKDMSSVITAEYVVYPYCYLTKASTTENWPTITKLATSRTTGYNLNYTKTHDPNATYYDIVTAETSGLRVKRGETFDLAFTWENAYWSGFSMFMDKGTGTLEEIFYGCGSHTDIVADTSLGEVKLETASNSSKSIVISADAEYGECLLRTVVADTHDACTSTKAQKIVDIFYLVCPAITVNAADATEGTVSVEADGASEQLNATKTYLIPAANTLTLTAAPAQGYLFSKWVDAGGAPLSTEATYQFAASEDIEVSAVFEADAPVPTEDKEVTADDAETGDAAYLTRRFYYGRPDKRKTYGKSRRMGIHVASVCNNSR